MHLRRNPIHVARLEHPNATEEQLEAYALDEERIMTAFTEDDETDK